MQKQKIRKTYLRTQRRNWGLTQKELATLIGTIAPTQVGHIENGKRDPSLRVALACQTIFGIAPATMFPDAFALSEEEVIRNMCRMDKALENSTNIVEMRKRELCAMALHRAITKSSL